MTGQEWDGTAAPPPPRYPVEPPPGAPPAYVPGPVFGTDAGAPIVPPHTGPPPFGGPPFGGAPFGSPPPPPASGVGLVAIGAAVILVPVIAFVAMWLFLLSAPSRDESAPPTWPVPAPTAEAEDDDPIADDPAAPDPGQVEATLQATIDDYKAALRDGSLWQRIPDTEFNRTAVVAFLYLVTDLKLAASFGADTSEYLAEAEELERRLLAEEPLGSDVRIVLSDRTFTYDGETGEGGYTDN